VRRKACLAFRPVQLDYNASANITAGKIRDEFFNTIGQNRSLASTAKFERAGSQRFRSN